MNPEIIQLTDEDIIQLTDDDIITGDVHSLPTIDIRPPKKEPDPLDQLRDEEIKERQARGAMLL